MKFFAFLAICTLVLLISPSQGRNGKRRVNSVEELTPMERGILRFLQPDLFAQAEQRKGGGGSIKDYAGVFELLQIDYPTIALLLSGNGDDIELPNVSLAYDFEFCIITCGGFQTSINLNGAIVKNAHQASLTTSVNDTSFQLHFHIPELMVVAPDLLVNHKPYPYTSTYLMSDLEFAIRNYTVSFSGDFVMREWGLQMVNLKSDFHVDEFHTLVKNNTFIDEDGSSREEEPIEYYAAEYWMEFWEEEKAWYAEELEIWLNCFLSDGRVGWKGCGEYLNDDLHQMSFAQLIHAVGLGQSLSHETSRAKPVKGESSLAFDKVSKKLSTEEDYFDYLNSIIFEKGTTLLLGSKFLGMTILTEFPIIIPFYFQSDTEKCNGSDCQQYHQQIQIGGYDDVDATTYFHGLQTNYAEINFGLSNFSYSFHMEDFRLDSYDFQSIEENLATQDLLVWNGLFIAIKNSTVGLSFDFHLENGMSISNLDLTLELGGITRNVTEVTVRENGNWRSLGGIEDDYAPEIMDILQEKDDEGRTVEERYEMHLEEKLNDLLAGRNKRI